MKKLAMLMVLALPLAFTFERHNNSPQTIGDANHFALPDLIITDLTPGIINVERFILPYTYEIKNRGAGAADLEKVFISLHWSKDSKEKSEYQHWHFLKNALPYQKTLAPGETLKQGFEIQIPEKNMKTAQNYPYLMAEVNGMFGNQRLLQESNTTNNFRNALVKFNIRDHRD